MGADASGLVFYGFALIDGNGKRVEPWKATGGGSVYSGWEERCLKAKAVPEYDEQEEDWDTWRNNRRALIKSCPVDVRLAGYDENLISCVVIKETFVEAEGVEVKPLKTLETKPEWDGQLREWCELLDVPYLKPGWFVASLYF